MTTTKSSTPKVLRDERYHARPMVESAVVDRYIADNGAEHALYMAFSAGRHGEVSYQTWLDNVATATYRKDQLAAKKRGEYQHKEGVAS